MLFILSLVGFFPGPSSASSHAALETLPKRSWWIETEKFLSSPHGHLSCSECHADIEAKGVRHPNFELLDQASTALYDYKKCERCHPQEYRRYLQGIHAKALLEKKKDAPTCGHCHVAHYVSSGRSRLELGKWMTEMCGTCHPAAKRTYLKNYHGKTATLLGYEASAYCTDCHGAHTVLSLTKKEDARAACQRCHANAGARFTGSLIHASEESVKSEDTGKVNKIRIIRWVQTGFALFVFGVLLFSYSHTLLWFLRKIHERLRKD